MPNVEKDAPPRCGEHFARHPDLPHLVAICTLPLGHEGAHDNLLTRVSSPGKGES